MMGFELAQNFDWPYLSRSIRDFWRRWHISLSSWLRDYLYIPLGGSREGPSRTAIAIVLTWFLGGLWHGAAWNFVVWGLYHGVLVSIASWTRRTGAAALWDHIPAPVQIAATFAAVTWGWVLFRSSNLSVAASMWAAMASPWRADFWRGTETFSALGLLLVIAAACTHVATYWLRRNAQATSVWMQWPYPVRAFALGITAFVTFALAGKSQSFIYFRF